MFLDVIVWIDVSRDTVLACYDGNNLCGGQTSTTAVETTLEAVDEAVRTAAAPVVATVAADAPPQPTVSSPPPRRPATTGRKWGGDVTLSDIGQKKSTKSDYLPAPSAQQQKKARYETSLVEEQEVAWRFKGRATYNKLREDEDTVVPWTKDGIRFEVQDHRPQPKERYEIVDPRVSHGWRTKLNLPRD